MEEKILGKKLKGFIQQNKLAEKYIIERDFVKYKGFAIKTKELNSEDWEESFFTGKTLKDALKGFWRKTEYWVFKLNDEAIFEDIWDAVEHAEDIADEKDISFDDFKKKVITNG